MLTPNGGVFGRNPTFNNVTVENNLTVNGDFTLGDDIVINDTLLVNGVATFRGGIISIPNSSAPTSNTVLGNTAGAALQSGATDNVLIGSAAGDAITTGDENVAIGTNALGANQTGTDCVAIGHAALLLNTASDITAVGANALDANTSGARNVAVGKDALGANGSGADNIAIGNGALDACQTHSQNIAIGTDALGSFSTATNAGGALSVAIGAYALASANNPLFSEPTSSVAIGNEALRLNTTGIFNIAVGGNALRNSTTGYANIAIGQSTLGAGSLSGDRNIVIGYAAGSPLTGASARNVFIGSESAASTTDASNSIFIGSSTNGSANSGQSNQIVIGHGTTGNGSNTTTIGNSSTTGTFIPAGDLILSGSTQQVLVGTATAPADDIKLQVQRDADAKIAVVAPISGGVANASVNLNASTQGSWVIQAGSAVSAGLRFYDVNAGGGSERIRFDASGNIDLKAGNLIIGTSGKGIDFAITSQGTGTMTSELLSDYEEGTFTPTYVNGITSPTYAEQTGWYTKIGRIVYFQIRVDLTAGTASAGQIQIAGLPFTSANNGSNGSAYVAYSSGWVASTTNVFPTLYVAPNTTRVDFYKNDANIFAGTDATGVLGYLTFQGFYIT